MILMHSSGEDPERDGPANAVSGRVLPCRTEPGHSSGSPYQEAYSI